MALFHPPPQTFQAGLQPAADRGQRLVALVSPGEGGLGCVSLTSGQMRRSQGELGQRRSGSQLLSGGGQFKRLIQRCGRRGLVSLLR